MDATKGTKWIELACPGMETPILTGKDAERFMQKMKNVKPISKEEKERMMRLYESITWEI
jgi:hypothetical protein